MATVGTGSGLFVTFDRCHSSLEFDERAVEAAAGHWARSSSIADTTGVLARIKKKRHRKKEP